jgi:hypothetical protein
MEKINCSECNKDRCPSRIEGALCSENKELAPLIKAFDSRDPIFVSRQLMPVLHSETERYNKAVANENIGEEYEEIIVDNKGNEHIVTKTREPNPDVTGIAKNLVSSAVKIHQMIVPPKVIGTLNQQNNQFNIGMGVANEIDNLPENEKIKAIEFINEKLNAA